MKGKNTKMKQKNIKERNWGFINRHSVLLSICLLFSSYFPVIMRYNINTLFNPNKRGYFDLFICNNLDAGEILERGQSKTRQSW